MNDHDIQKVFSLAFAAKELVGYPKLKPLLDMVLADLEAMIQQPPQPESADDSVVEEPIVVEEPKKEETDDHPLRR